MKGCFDIYMRKMGTFKGLPVFMITDHFEWENMKNNPSYEEKIYVVGSCVYYKYNLIAMICDNTLIDFNEELFNELRRKSWDDDRAKMLGYVTGSAETRPQEEEKPVLSDAERAAAQNDIAGQFMLEWRNNIDKESAELKLAVAEMENGLNEKL